MLIYPIHESVRKFDEGFLDLVENKVAPGYQTSRLPEMQQILMNFAINHNRAMIYIFSQGSWQMNDYAYENIAFFDNGGGMLVGNSYFIQGMNGSIIDARIRPLITLEIKQKPSLQILGEVTDCGYTPGLILTRHLDGRRKSEGVKELIIGDYFRSHEGIEMPHFSQ